MSKLKSQLQTNRLDPERAAVDLAHALAGPLESLTAMAEMLQRQPLGPAATAQLTAIAEIAQRMTETLGDVVDTPDVAAAPAASALSLRTLVDDVEAHWRSTLEAGAAPLLISTNAPPDLRVVIDAPRLIRLLNTLIKDALASRAWGAVEVQLTVQMESGGPVLLSGRVESPGTPKDAANPIALELCRAIVRQMGGDLQRILSAGSGVQTLFTLSACEAGRDLASEDDDGEVDGPLPPRTHLLIVDDNATNRIVAAALCEMFGCTSETVEDGVEAVDAVKSRHFDLILMDIKMPRMDGLEATKAIRSLPGPASRTPIVALTANADPDAVATYIEGGMQAVVDKPIKPAQLLSTLQSALGAKDQSADAQSSAA